MSERELQDQFDAWLRERRVPFYRSRMDRATTGTLGWPDFTVVIAGRALLVETKDGKGKLSARQAKLHAELRRTGTTTHVCRDFHECVRVTEAWLYGHEAGVKPALPEVVKPIVSEIASHYLVGGEFEAMWGGKRVVLRENADGSATFVRSVK